MVKVEFKNRWHAWSSKATRCGRSLKIAVDAKVALGCNISAKKKLYSYFGELNSRPVMLTFLDGEDGGNCLFEEEKGGDTND